MLRSASNDRAVLRPLDASFDSRVINNDFGSRADRKNTTLVSCLVREP